MTVSWSRCILRRALAKEVQRELDESEMKVAFGGGVENWRDRSETLLTVSARDRVNDEVKFGFGNGTRSAAVILQAA